jgi:hypothetical protein
MGQHEIAHVIERESALETFRRDLPRAEHAAGVVDEHVDPWLGRRDLRSRLLDLGDQRKIGVMGTMGRVRPDLAQPRQRRFGALPVARDHDDAGALPRQPLRRDPADARRCPGDDDDLAADGWFRHLPIL